MTSFFLKNIKQLFELSATVLILFSGCDIVNPTMQSCHYSSSFMKGMNIFFYGDLRNRFIEQDFSESLSRLRKDGVTDLFLVPYWFSHDKFSDSIFHTDSETIRTSDLVCAVSLAKDSGFNVIIKPHIDLLDKIPRYLIQPRSMTKWSKSYLDFIKHYALLSDSLGLKEFVIGTELDIVSETDEFKHIIEEIRKVYKGTLIYASSWDHHVNARVWKYVDVIGVNAWFNLDNSDRYSMNVLMDSWNYRLNELTEVAINFDKKIIITEAGYFSSNGTAKNPGAWENRSGINLDEQKDCYEALLSQACHFEKITGIFWWQWELGKIGGSNNSDYTPRDKPAEQVLEKYWSTE
jgi:hypothetical protein